MFQPGTIEVGDLIDSRYRILEALGQGGMGMVYRAEHVGIKREVAIKILHSELRGDDAINERLMREAFATARLDHPNCVSVTDSGTLEGGVTFLVMELLLGQSLGDELEDRTTLPLNEAIHITREVLKGLQHAHSLGIVHRDLKPDNIFLISQHDGPPHVKILDFGIVKLQGDALSEIGGVDLTQAGMAIGSPIYMSPEQATGSDVDERTDLYSLSLVFYEMLVGEPPFYERGDKMQSLKRRLHESPPLLVLDDSRGFSDSLQDLIHYGLGKMPPDRISTATEYMRALDALCADAKPARSATNTEQVNVQVDAPVAVQALGQGQGHPIARHWSSMGAEAKRVVLVAGALGVAFLAILLFTRGGADEKETVDVEPELVMDPDYVETDGGESTARFEAALDRIAKQVESGSGAKALTTLQKMHAASPSARTNRLVGLAYMAKRYWKDGFKHLRIAVAMDPSFQNDEWIIKSAIRSLSSKRRPNLGVRFLVEVIGEPGISYLEETIAGGSPRQQEHASRALAEIRSRNL